MFQGSMVALVTPMQPDCSVDIPALNKLIEFHIENNTDAIVAMGTTGESATFSHNEHQVVIRQVIQQVNERIPVIAGTGSNSTSEAVALTKFAKEAGASGVLLVTPYYNKPPQEGLYQHYKTIAESVDIPQILYNVPGRTACDLLPETVQRLAKFDNIIGIKEATGDLKRLHRIRELCGDNFELYSGDDATAAEFILQGGQGGISVTANVAPKALKNLYQAALDKDITKVKEIDSTLIDIHNALFLEANPIPVKWALYEMGYIQHLRQEYHLEEFSLASLVVQHLVFGKHTVFPN